MTTSKQKKTKSKKDFQSLMHPNKKFACKTDVTKGQNDFHTWVNG